MYGTSFIPPVLAVLGLSATVSTAQASDDGAVVYRLDPVSQYTEGCFPPCLCPAWTVGPVRGVFTLTYAGADPLFWHYRIDDVYWIFGGSGGEWIVTGTGEYEIGGEFALTQRLELDLQVGDEPMRHFDSGVVVGGRDFPTIAISVSVNGFYCYDYAFDLVARPVPEREIAPFALRPTSRYQEGCWPPCTCPILDPRPMAGRFSLVPLREAAGTSRREFALIGVDLQVPEPDPSAAERLSHRFTGAGHYVIDTSTAEALQRLTLGVREGDSGDILRFDSGSVPASSTFPVIEVDASMNGLVCYDRLLMIDARPATAIRPVDSAPGMQARDAPSGATEPGGTTAAPALP